MIILDKSENKSIPENVPVPGKTIFVHIPKTGGNTVLRNITNEVQGLINNSKDGSIYWDDLKSIALDDSNKEIRGWINGWHNHRGVNLEVLNNLKQKGFYSFSVVRDPFDRALSCYNWYRSYLAKQHKVTFVEFLKSRSFMEASGLFAPQSSFICDKDGNVLVEKVCKLENLQEDMKEVCQKINLDYDQMDFGLVINKNKREKPLPELYRSDPMAKDLVLEIYKKDFEIFRYREDYE